MNVAMFLEFTWRLEEDQCHTIQKKMYTLRNQRLKITQLEKVCFFKVNERKLTQVDLF